MFFLCPVTFMSIQQPVATNCLPHLHRAIRRAYNTMEISRIHFWLTWGNCDSPKFLNLHPFLSNCSTICMCSTYSTTCMWILLSYFLLLNIFRKGNTYCQINICSMAAHFTTSFTLHPLFRATQTQFPNYIYKSSSPPSLKSDMELQPWECF